ncbi:MAG: hypothetical protein K5686_10780 [Lachnospiraceae bacterium]|nr:hypothetical protein [Lachnospiraceae bacterium]
MAEIHGKINNLKTKMLPPLLMMLGGAVALVMCLIRRVAFIKMLIILLVSFFCFAVIGTVIKCIVDRFNMQNSYEDYLQEAESFTDDGDLMEK